MPKKLLKKQITSFQKKVYEIVGKIPGGRVMSYKEVAKAAGSPKAYRAVGNIMHRNPDPKKVPCHRVVRSDGRVGGYARGTKAKTAILKKEGVEIKNGRYLG